MKLHLNQIIPWFWLWQEYLLPVGDHVLASTMDCIPGWASLIEKVGTHSWNFILGYLKIESEKPLQVDFNFKTFWLVVLRGFTHLTVSNALKNA